MEYKLKGITLVFSFVLAIGTNASAQWMSTSGPPGGGMLVLAAMGSDVYASASIYQNSSNGQLTGGGLYQLTSTGWVLAGLASQNVFAVASLGKNIFAGTENGLFCSTDSGKSWIECSGLQTSSQIFALSALGTYLFSSTSSGVYKSTDSGITWNYANKGLPSTTQFTYVTSFSMLGTIVFAASIDSGIFCSRDNGASWSHVRGALRDSNIFALAVSQGNLFAGTEYNGVSLSTDTGQNWISVNSGLFDTQVFCFAVLDSNIFVGTGQGGVFLSSNNGKDWAPVNIGLTSDKVYELVVNNSNLFAGLHWNGVWRRPLSEIIPLSAVSEPRLPTLEIASYPNPLTHSTTITFTAPESGPVEVTIVNLLGTEVARLYSGELLQGPHSFTWDASGMAPGMYECLVRMNGKVMLTSLIFGPK